MASNKDKLPAPSSDAEVQAFLEQMASLPAAGPRGRMGRLIFALDATASREPTWDRACHIQAEMFTETAALGTLAVQLVYFRGFGEFDSSPFEVASEALLKRMVAVFCLGGRTQIARVLRHGLRESAREKVDALVYVGDCCEESVDELCALAGELGLHGVPAFMFHEGHDAIAERAYRQIARLTGGVYCRFDASSADTLRQLLSAVAVYAVGGRAALEDFNRRAGRAVLSLPGPRGR
ncbi:MAG TPA: VWA domain-containing protein [Alphaproteobacteria bacterium]